ncbi:MAG: hypothetical protein NUV58_02450, partial [Candidatus Roizmanbacteria bacterium]|nr:hypothetical protein [Candidatus Roizmanbacteria bacterium]
KLMEPIQTPTQQSPQTPPEIIVAQPKPNYLKTIFFSILGVLLVSSIIYLYLQNQTLKKQALNPPISPTIEVPSPTTKPSSSISIPPDETAGWKTYISSKANYSFKYPDSWPIVKLSTNVNCETCVEIVPFALSYDPQSAESELSVILVFKDSRIKTLDDYKNIIVKGDSSIIDVHDTTIGLEKSISYKLSGGIPPLPIIEYVVVKNDFYYVIRFVNSKETNKNLVENQKIFDQILSTFKFLSEPRKCLTVEDPCNPQSCDYDLSKCIK